MKAPTIKFKILNKPWKIRALTAEQYSMDKARKDSVAITYMHRRVIDLSPSGMDKESVIHELVHAYLHEMCVHSSDLDTDQLEEFYAELLAKRGFTLLKQADSLYKRLKKMRSK